MIMAGVHFLANFKILLIFFNLENLIVYCSDGFFTVINLNAKCSRYKYSNKLARYVKSY